MPLRAVQVPAGAAQPALAHLLDAQRRVLVAVRAAARLREGMEEGVVLFLGYCNVRFGNYLASDIIDVSIGCLRQKNTR